MAGTTASDSPIGSSAAPHPMMIATTTGHSGKRCSNPAQSPPATAPTPNTAQNAPSRPAEPCSPSATWIGNATSTGPYRKKNRQVTATRPSSCG